MSSRFPFSESVHIGIAKLATPSWQVSKAQKSWLPTPSISDMNQHEQDVSTWPVIFPGADGALKECVLHVSGWGLRSGVLALGFRHCWGCYSKLKCVLFASPFPCPGTGCCLVAKSYPTLSAGSTVMNWPANEWVSGDAGLSPRLKRSPGGENGNPLQYSCSIPTTWEVEAWME